MINFDKNGNIEPYNVIESSVDVLQKYFTFNNHRKDIFDEYLIFCNTLKLMGIKTFYQFIDGSFITRKVLPKDIDVVTFLEANFFNQNAVKLLNLRDDFSRIGCFFVPNYQSEERNYFVTQFGLFEWEQLFNTDHEYNPKGILKIIF